MIGAEVTVNGYMLHALVHRDLGAEPLSDGDAKVFAAEALIDTGATGIFIDPSVASALDLKQIDTDEIETAGGRVGVLIYTGVLEVPVLKLKKRLRIHAPAVKKISYSIVLGREFISQYHVFIDGPRGRVTFTHPPMHYPLVVEEDHDG